MHRTMLVRSVTAVAVMIAMSACDTQSGPEAAGSPPPAPAPATTSAAAPSSSADDAATREACAAIKTDLKDNEAKVAKAEKIGPPAGHIAVSAQWTAGSTAVLAHSIGASDAVSAAADEVQREMQELSDKYNESAKAKPSRKKLEAAVAKLTAACSGA
ncbi:hypothetical protein [Actinoplanes sp. NPDC049265]|uniref:hypothetical protein n=1 Tax=Actinoplanes sp. NPDC049265 TaxID=3363902 RepID=UPI00372293E0